MTLQEASTLYSVAGLDPACLKDQEQAFQRCLDFLSTVEKTKQENKRHMSYGLKHILEDPSRLCPEWTGGDSSNPYGGYVYEGTLILAALASGFAMKQRGKHMKVTFNMSERSLRNRCKEYLEKHAKAR
jgi:hypothetical protein